MAHRAEQIVDAIAAIIAARVQPPGAHVFTHRRLSVDPYQDELPLVSVDFGDDTPAADNTQFIDSVLTVPTTAVAVGPEERDVKLKLLELRREVHRAIMADPTLGLAFVVYTNYGGAAEPVYETDGELLVGELTSNWFVHYRMNVLDPGD